MELLCHFVSFYLYVMITYPPIISRNCCSLMIGMPSLLAFSSFDGPILSPASTKSVFLDMEPTFLPPFFFQLGPCTLHANGG